MSTNFVFLISFALFAATTIAASTWPDGVTSVRAKSSVDGTLQPLLFYAPKTEEPRPLLVALHTWSGSYKQTTGIPYANWCVENGWVFVYPHFRGPNWTAQACGSELAVQDILDAVEEAKKKAKVDEGRIYCVGVSGGGHAALLMAGRAPKRWAGVSAWASISDIKAWYFECQARKIGYAGHIVKACGGVPEPGSEAEAECRKRSPLNWLARAAKLPLDINAGIHDGHQGRVPISYSIRAFNLLAAPKDRIAKEDVQALVEEASVPEHLRFAGEDHLYGKKEVLLRKESGNVRLTLFDGGHEIVYKAALEWLSRQHK